MIAEDFADYGWRIPFMVSIGPPAGLDLGAPAAHREPGLREDEGGRRRSSKAPFKEAFLKWGNVKYVFIALFGCVAGQAVIWYSGTLYGLFFLQQTLKLPDIDAYEIMAIALTIGTPSYVFFGWLSDKIGRKPLILAGLLLPVLSYHFLFHKITEYANPALAEASASSPVVVRADPATCSLQFDPVGKNKFDTTSCDVVKNYLPKQGVSYDNQTLPAGQVARDRHRHEDVRRAGHGQDGRRRSALPPSPPTRRRSGPR